MSLDPKTPPHETMERFPIPRRSPSETFRDVGTVPYADWFSHLFVGVRPRPRIQVSLRIPGSVAFRNHDVTDPGTGALSHIRSVSSGYFDPLTGPLYFDFTVSPSRHCQ
jgi:hypothetical protein